MTTNNKNKVLKAADLDLDLATAGKQDFAVDVLHGLSQTPKRLPAKYLYDNEGSRLFSKIMDLPTYYLTDCEWDILENQTGAFANLITDQPFHLIELGAGDGRKTSLLLNHFLEKNLEFDYVPIDISQGAVDDLVGEMTTALPDVKTMGLVADYFTGLQWLAQNSHRPNLVLFLGSSLGNFLRSEADHFLHNLWNSLNHGDYFVIGFDLKKDISLLQAAYDDPQGVTAQFNYNYLHRINRELGGDFKIDQFLHHATYNVNIGAMESYLVSKKKQSVHLGELDRSFDFRAWEGIHVEYSHKYSEEDIADLADLTGFDVVDNLYDSKGYFVDSIWKVDKSQG